MEASNPEVPLAPSPSTLPYKDRSAGLMVFGLFTILLGCISALLVPMMVWGQSMAARTTGAPATWSALIPGMLLYAVLAVALIWLGVGSIIARRWARALLLIISWGWLLMGTWGFAMTLFLMPGIRSTMAAGGPGGQPGPPPEVLGIIVAGMFVILGVCFIGIPGLWAYFYSRPNVKATCETRDPVARWTDACPLPVLGLCLWLAVSMLMMLILPFTVRGVTPFFGTYLTGVPGTAYYFIVAAVWGYAARSLYKLDVRGWWLTLIAMCAFFISALLTNARHDINEMYQLMGYPEAQIEQMQKTGLLVGNRMSWFILFFVALFVGYLIYIKKFFRPEKA